jgi:TPR repeat protein
MGTIFENGEMVHRDLLEALKWYSKAASQGNENAHSHLDLNFEDSNLVSQFNNNTIKYIRRVIELEKMQFNLISHFSGNSTFS